MKNKKLLTVFGISLLVVFLLTWLIPTSTSTTNGVTLGAITPVGLADIFSSIDIILYYNFSKPAIFILFVGMFYGVINKSGAYKALVDKVSTIFKNETILFAIITTVFYSATTAMTGIYLPMFTFIPFSIAVLLELKYKKVSALFLTVGSTVIGLLAQIPSATYNNAISVETNTFLWIKAGLLFVLVAVNIIYAIKTLDNKKSKNKEEETASENMFVPEKRDAKNKKAPKGIALFVVMILLFVVFVLGLTPWSSTEVFQNAYTAIKNVKIGNFEVFNSILGTFEVFGSWSLTSVYVTLGFAIVVAAITNKLKFGEMVEGCMEGAKKVFGLSVLAALTSLFVIFALNSGFLITIINFIAKSGNIALVTLSSLIASPLMVDESYAAQYLIQVIYTITANESLLELYALIVQLMYGFTMLIAPSSILLIITLYYLNESYKNWLKYVWKILLVILSASLIAITIATLI